jgi:hypothetical protein
VLAGCCKRSKAVSTTGITKISWGCCEDCTISKSGRSGVSWVVVSKVASFRGMLPCEAEVSRVVLKETVASVVDSGPGAVGPIGEAKDIGGSSVGRFSLGAGRGEDVNGMPRAEEGGITPESVVCC